MRASVVLLLRFSCVLVVVEVGQRLHPLQKAASGSVAGASADHRMKGMLRCSSVACTARLAKLVPGFAGCFCSSGVVPHGRMDHRRDRGHKKVSVRWSSAVPARSCAVLERLGPSANERHPLAVAGRVLDENGHRSVTWPCHVLLSRGAAVRRPASPRMASAPRTTCRSSRSVEPGSGSMYAVAVGRMDPGAVADVQVCFRPNLMVQQRQVMPLAQVVDWSGEVRAGHGVGVSQSLVGQLAHPAVPCVPACL